MSAENVPSPPPGAPPGVTMDMPAGNTAAAPFESTLGTASAFSVGAPVGLRESRPLTSSPVAKIPPTTTPVSAPTHHITRLPAGPTRPRRRSRASWRA